MTSLKGCARLKPWNGVTGSLTLTLRVRWTSNAPFSILFSNRSINNAPVYPLALGAAHGVVADSRSVHCPLRRRKGLHSIVHRAGSQLLGDGAGIPAADTGA